ncbi:hypothetical protein WH47_00813 [Habropoda laboriosa]|uniref:DUF7041 domain-containing protein n=1 Tax=Habropoda laboriosa TaxID=597456 RepID=A0A0L7QK36_9HYME|nr:hypothetical protein WH47_00813 [Habropoda laboriosa]
MPERLRVGFHAHPFWPEEPGVRFNQLEAQFMLNGLTADDTKFYYVMAQLDPKYAREVQDIFNDPPETGKYEKLKTELIRRLSASQSQRIRQLLEQEEIGDRKPSQFLRRMRDLAGSSVSDDFLRTLWSGRLPEMTPAIVTAQTDLPLTKLAEIADQIHEGTARSQVASVAINDSTERLIKQLEGLQTQIAELQRLRPSSRKGGNFHQRSWSRSASAKRGKSPSRNAQCWYHRKFGAESTKCRAPCNFVAGN